MDMFDSHKKQLKEYYELAKTEPDSVNFAYQFIKDIVPIYCNNGEKYVNYRLLCDILGRIEELALTSDSVLEYHSIFNASNPPCKDDKISYIVWSARKELMNVGSDSLDLCNYSFYGLCGFAMKDIAKKSADLGLKCKKIQMFPGFSYYTIIPWTHNFHCFNIIEFDSKKYLVDITLEQFFYKCDNHPGRMGIYDLNGPSVGYYMLKLNRGEELAKKLLVDGYVLLDDELFKTYMDSFMLSFRNALYYEKNGIALPMEGIILPQCDDILPYNIDQYISFLNKKDNQVKHEGYQCLGRQRKLLKDPKVSIFR